MLRPRTDLFLFDVLNNNRPYQTQFIVNTGQSQGHHRKRKLSLIQTRDYSDFDSIIFSIAISKLVFIFNV